MSGLLRVQAPRPAADRRGIEYAIRVFEPRPRFFPGAVPLKAPPQGLATSRQAVVGVRERNRSEEVKVLRQPGQWPGRIPIQS